MRPALKNRPTLVIFARWPHFAQGKRRYAEIAGEGAAYRFQTQRCLALARGIGRDHRWQTRWFTTGVTPHSFRSVLQVGPQDQGRGDLGQRMHRALHTEGGRGRGAGRAVVLIGSDIPAVTSAHITHALALLRHADIVYGPAEDGGFWLVGWSGRCPLPSLFTGVGWSQPTTLIQCLNRLQVLPHRRIAFAACLQDMDAPLSPGSYSASSPS